MSPTTVFIVDDDPSHRESLQLLLESAGLEVRSFSSAIEFLDGADSETPGCLLLDVHMPGMSGFQLKQYLTASHTSIPMIFITGHDRPGMEGQALTLGAIAYLRKPFDEQAILKAIQPYCR